MAKLTVRLTPVNGLTLLVTGEVLDGFRALCGNRVVTWRCDKGHTTMDSVPWGVVPTTSAFCRCGTQVHLTKDPDEYSVRPSH